MNIQTARSELRNPPKLAWTAAWAEVTCVVVVALTLVELLSG